MHNTSKYVSIIYLLYVDISPNPLLEVTEGDEVAISCTTTLSLDTLQLLVNGVAVDVAFSDAEDARTYQLGAANRQDDGNIIVCSTVGHSCQMQLFSLFSVSARVPSQLTVTKRHISTCASRY